MSLAVTVTHEHHIDAGLFSDIKRRLHTIEIGEALRIVNGILIVRADDDEFILVRIIRAGRKGSKGFPFLNSRFVRKLATELVKAGLPVHFMDQRVKEILLDGVLCYTVLTVDIANATLVTANQTIHAALEIEIVNDSLFLLCHPVASLIVLFDYRIRENVVLWSTIRQYEPLIVHEGIVASVGKKRRRCVTFAIGIFVWFTVHTNTAFYFAAV